MENVLHSFAYALQFLGEQLDGVPSADMVKQPGGIQNHPAWVIGHLTFTCQMIGGVIGIEPWLPDGFEKRYGSGSTPVSNAGAYESKEDALARLGEARDRIIRAVEGLSDAQLAQPFPAPAYRYVFPSIRHALTQVLAGHTAFHIGQISVWRRAMGLPAMTRSFE